MSPASLAGKRVTVMGLGRFGGGVGVARWLAAQGADILITDLDPAERLAESIAQLNDLIDNTTVTLRLGGHNVSDFTNTDLVIANPAVPKPWENRFLRAAEAARVPITTEIRLLTERLPDREKVIAVTGSVGKSTTSAMIAHILKDAGRGVFFGGNIGGSLLAELPRMTPDSDIVLEISSAMMHWLSPGIGCAGAPGWSPHVAVATNITANHLDWHGDFAHYERSKQQILRDQTAEDRAVIADFLSHWPGSAPRVTIESIPADVPPLAIPGRHNRLNAAFAIAAAALAGVPRERAASAVATFPGLPDRLQFVGTFGGVRAYNDSKSTTPDAARLAVDAMDHDPDIGASRVRLICGGYDKKIDLTPLAHAAARCAAAYTIGATGEWLADAIARAGGRAAFRKTLDHAVADALTDSRPGDTILLSPGCASWDQFTNYEERGRRFEQLLRNAT
ncbi:MAG: UDP-N-acetylmuramoyl-L-alanine--D-glutamate ligase [Phycisphaerae bacterium]|nr:UDP-N-acetylmuramoyl-L-alanine--D-glutamate ligase [Phycisphaerae bacterium]